MHTHMYMCVYLYIFTHTHAHTYTHTHTLYHAPRTVMYHALGTRIQTPTLINPHIVS